MKMSQIWSLIIDDAHSAFYNMACDEVLFDACCQDQKTPLLRFYSWSSPAVSIGYNQKVTRAVNLPACRENQIELVRRITGGRAVLHQHELTYSLTIPSSNSIFSEVSLKQSYYLVSQALIRGFAVLGLKQLELSSGSTRNRDKESNLKGACFASSSWQEILYQNKKILGSAQKRCQDGFLQQGSILLDIDWNTQEKFFSFHEFNKINLSNSWSSYACGATVKMTSLSQALSSLLDLPAVLPPKSEIIEAFVKGFKEFFNIELVNKVISKEESKQLEDLITNKYSRDEWNFQKY